MIIVESYKSNRGMNKLETQLITATNLYKPFNRDSSWQEHALKYFVGASSSGLHVY